MGDKKEEKKSLLETIDDTIIALEKRFGELSARLNMELNEEKQGGKKLSTTDNADIARIKKEMAQVTSQISYAKDVRKDCEEQLEKAKTEDEKEQIENALKGAILLGVVGENLRIRVEREKAVEQKKKEKTQESFTKLVEEIFERGNYKYVKAEQIEEIINDKEFRDMAANDPLRLKRKEQFVRDDYQYNLEKMLVRNGIEISDNPEENERNLAEARNEYEKGERVMESIVPSSMKLGTVEEQKEVDWFRKEFRELKEITKRLQEDFRTGKSSFREGNGYTKELIQREKTLLDRVTKFRETQFSKVMEAEAIKKKAAAAGQTVNESTDSATLWQLGIVLEEHAKAQYNYDKTLQGVNEFNATKERWDVFTQIPLERRGSIAYVDNEQADRDRIWNKPKRLTENSARRGGIHSTLGAWASEDLQQLIIRIMDPRPIKSKEEKDWVKEKLGSFILYHIVDMEMKYEKQLNFVTPYHTKVRFLKKADEYHAVVKEMIQSKDYKKVVDNLIKGDLKQKVSTFLSRDLEKDVARKMTNLRPELDRSIRK